MSLNTQAPKKSEDVVFALLAFPFKTLEAAGSRVVSAFANQLTRQPKETQETPAGGRRVPDVTANQKFLIADRVHSADVRGRKVSFYQYHSANVIRIACRELRHLKPIDFTPAIADAASLVYDIDGAIQWVRANGLESDAVKRASKLQGSPAKVSTPISSPPWETEEKTVQKRSAPPAAPKEQLNVVPATGNKSKPFTGHIVSYGTTTIKSEGRKPYTTYAMTLRSETGSYEKQFIGEHLADLVAELELQEGQLVRLQLLGKHHFEVEVNGKMEARSRNTFAIETL